MLLLFSAAAAKTVSTTLGRISGKTVTAYDNSTIDAYFGIPFAAPPLEHLRFAKPVPHEPWTTTRDATKHGNCCVQFGFATISSDSPDVLGHEDCLVLDVYAPSPTGQNRPVLVWFYGGSFLEGCINLYDMKNLAARTGAIVVAVNYRLSALGYLGLPEQVEDGSTNAGLHDMRLGLKFVHDNAHAFGGDPDRITIFGQSAGGAAVLFQLVMPMETPPLFHSAILQSPGGRKGWVQDLKSADNDALSKAEMVNHSIALASTRGCGSTPSPQRLACMRNLSVSALMAEPFGRFAPAADGKLIADDPLKLVAAGKWSKMPVILGGTSCESCAGQGMFIKPGPPRTLSKSTYLTMLNETFGPSRFSKPVDVRPKEVEQMYEGYAAKRGYWRALTRIASDDGHACNAFLLTSAFTNSSNAPVYRYEFRAAGGHPGQEYPGAVHASELSYLFRTQSPYEPSKLNPEQDQLALYMQDRWGELASKAKVGPMWPPCTKGVHPCDHVMVFDTPHATIETELTADDGSAAQHCARWAEFM